MNIKQQIERFDGFSNNITRDNSFGLRSRFFSNRAIFKKTSSNKGGTFGFPINEARALGLNAGDPVNILGVRLNFREFIKINNIELKKDSRGFFTFSIPQRIFDRNDIPPEDLAPVQFVAARIAPEEPNPNENLGAIGKRGKATAGDFMVWKQNVKSDDNGNKYVTVEANERDYFNIEPGDQISLSTIPVLSEDIFSTIKGYFNNATRVTVTRSPGADDANSVRVYFNNLANQFGYNEGTIVQCIAQPI